MKNPHRPLRLIAVLCCLLPFISSAAFPVRDDMQAVIDIYEDEDGIVEISGALDLLPAIDEGFLNPRAEGPQAPDTLSVDLTNELLGAGLVKVVVRKGVKSVKKLFKKAKASHAARVAARNFPRKGCFGTVRVVTYNVGVFTKSGFDRTAMAADMLREMKADVVRDRKSVV